MRIIDVFVELTMAIKIYMYYIQQFSIRHWINFSQNPAVSLKRF